jgi:hypothetical protein
MRGLKTWTTWIVISLALVSGCCTEIVEPTAPQLYGVIPGNGSLTLYWTPAVYEERERKCGTHPPDPDFEGFNVYMYFDSTYYDSSREFHEGFKVNSAYVRTGEYEIGGLVNGTTYFLHVTAFWKTGASWKSNPGSGIPKADSLVGGRRQKPLLGG